MCNAQNHPVNCTCGWGGDGHSGKGGGVYVEQQFRTRESYTVPNASCPVCGANVFFYRSPDNGRVFFDSLGPPWPKHPCTDNSAGRTRSAAYLPYQNAKFTLNARPEPGWLAAGWRPYLVNVALPRKVNSKIRWGLYGKLDLKDFNLLVLSPTFPQFGLCLVREVRPDFFEIAVMYYSGSKDKVTVFKADARPSAELPAPIPSVKIKRPLPMPRLIKKGGALRGKAKVNKAKAGPPGIRASNAPSVCKTGDVQRPPLDGSLSAKSQPVEMQIFRSRRVRYTIEVRPSRELKER